MADTLVTQLVEGYRRYPIDDYGKLRISYCNVAALAVALPANDTITMFKMPPGRCRIWLPLSRISTSAWGAARTINVGHLAYPSRPYAEADPNAIDADAFIAGMDVSAAVNAAAWGTQMKFDVYSLTEWQVQLKILGGTMPIAGTLEAMICYTVE